tara:strand:- start:205 stop:1134 length:930 start_codon:yes stop_codon:yes gene_type:complete
MKNTHINHPEDSVLTGDLSVLKWFTSKGNLSVKMDGSPAIVWGTNPATGNFFVGTKSVFNKVKIMINESHEDIDTNHGHIAKVANILHKCFDELPRTEHIYQGDFIGFGGDNVYQPNTIAYVFGDVISQKLIITPHTRYACVGDLRNAVSYQLDYQSFLKDCVEIDSDEDIFWLYPYVDIDEDLSDIVSLCDYASAISGAADYMSTTTANKVIKSLNSIITSGLVIDDLTLIALADYHHVDINVLRLWKLVWTIKHEFMLHIATYNEVECYIGGEEVGHEGYVLSNDYGTFKLIYREVFSNANFNRVRA